MIRKTMRIGEVRTSIKLEAEFWSYLKEVADGRSLRLSTLVNEVAEATPDRTNLASTLRTFSLIHARMRGQSLERELEKLALAGNTQDLARVLEACPLPSLVLDTERSVRQRIWLAPTQAVVMNITRAQDAYVQRVVETLRNQGIRTEIDLRNEKVGFKIRAHTLQRVPYLLVAGDKEVAANQISVRTLSGKDLGTMSPEDFVSRLRAEVESHGRTLLEG